METMTRMEELQSIYWDLYKDAHGIRPRGIDTSSWSEADFNKEFENLNLIAELSCRQRQADEQDAAQKFEQHVTNTICMGAGDRETALRWIMDASNANGDWEYLCYDLGLPYRYFVKEAV